MKASTTEKDKGVAYLCWVACFVGIAGAHRLYQGKIGTGLLWLFTFGLLGIGQLVDLFTLGGQIERHNLKVASVQNRLPAPGTSKSGSGERAIPNINYLRQRFAKLDKMYFADLITDEEASKRKLDIIVDVAQDSDHVEDVISVAGDLKSEDLLTDDEFARLKG
ncbi:MAG: TM2 domain-containing protein, partial [Rhodothermales bacterium]|nr:TM2 domain-containing protein [Rhodothermales bacterium]